MDGDNSHVMHVDALSTKDEPEKKNESEKPKEVKPLLRSLTCHPCLSYKDLSRPNLMLNLGSFLICLKSCT